MEPASRWRQPCLVLSVARGRATLLAVSQGLLSVNGETGLQGKGSEEDASIRGVARTGLSETPCEVFFCTWGQRVGQISGGEAQLWQSVSSIFWLLLR